MATLRSITLAAALLLSGAAFAQTAAEHAAHHPADGASAPSAKAPAAKPPATGSAGMADMDAHMKAMRAMHDRMAAAKTAKEREALMAEHMKLMQQGMVMMGGMPGGMGGMGMGAMPGAAASAPMDPQMRQQMMEKRMDMMQSMMQMMMDRMQATPPASK